MPSPARLQVQERLTTQIRDCIQETLQPLGVAVVIEAQHLCMQMRGVRKQNSVTTTSAFTGEFENDKPAVNSSPSSGTTALNRYH